MFKKFTCFAVLLLCFCFCRAQTSRHEKLLNDIYALKQAYVVNPQDTAHYYLVKLKNPANLKATKLHLLKQLPDNYYIVSSAKEISAGENIISASPANSLWKAADDLAQQSRDHPNSTKQITLVLNSTTGSVIADIKKVSVITGISGNTLTLKTILKNLPTLLQNTQVVFASPVRKAHTELVIQDLDLGANNISAIPDNYPGINGNGINLSVKEEDFDETDLDLLGRSFASAPKADNISGHATIMATLIGGNGNSFIKGLGAAPAIKFTSSDFARLLPDSLPFFKNFNISVQNHSYGTGIENYYGIEAVAYDAQVYGTDSIMHVFSSGNIGTTTPTTGLYNGIANVANLSGTFKQAKNVLVVGGTGRTNIPEALSSSGPAYDGRVKPELVSDGEDGTSGAAALTSGAVALLQQAYKKQYGKLPSSALLKSVLINSADDIGLPHIDHKTGYGKLNALEALRTLTDGRFKTGSLTNGQQSSYQLTVPANTAELKVSLAWADAPATLNAPFALVNDLDLKVSTPTGQILLPWVLSNYPATDSLLKPAVQKRDTLNNTEQVTISHPEAGVYTLTVTGSRVSGNQPFYVAYQAKTADQFEWTYPSGNNKLFAADDNYLRWQSTYSTATGKISVSYDNGITWQQVADVNPADGFYKWTASAAFTKALLKMTIGSKEYFTKEITLSKPLTLNVGYNCTDGTLLHWNAQPGATGYTIYNIKDNLIQALTTSTDTSIVIPTQMLASNYFAVSANGMGFEGLRSLTLDITQQGVGCYVKTLLADVVNNNSIRLTLSLGSTLNLQKITWEKQTGINKYIAIGSTNITAGNANYTFIDTNPKKGLNYYRATLTTSDGKTINSDLASAILLQDNQFTLFPNPVSTDLNILAAQSADYELKIYDIMGVLRFTKAFNGLQNTIPVTVIPGTYVCTIALNGKILYKGKIIKL